MATKPAMVIPYATRGMALANGAMCCSALQCVAVCCSVLQCVAVCQNALSRKVFFALPFGEWHSRMVQCVAVRCGMLQFVAVCCSVLQCVRMPYLERSFSLHHSGNGICEWSGHRCVLAISREFPFSFSFPQNSFGEGGVNSSHDFPAKKNKLRLTQ